MPVFGLSDMTFSVGDNPRRGPLGVLAGSQFERNSFRYPIDLGNYDKAHYVTFYIRQQKQTKYPRPTVDESAIPPDPFNKQIGRKSLLPPTTQLTVDSISLYMPDTIMYSQQQSYDNLAIGSEIKGQIGAAAKSLYDEKLKGNNEWDYMGILKSAGIQGAFTAAANFAQGSPTLEYVYAAATGTVLNPMLELIYRSPNFRTFQFDFVFYPRSRKEAQEVQRIIKRFEFHQAPELAKVGGAETKGFLVPPSEFDIAFFYGGDRNTNVPPIATSVLTNIQVNYAPNGWSAYEILGQKPTPGGTGMPVAIQMSLQFQETTYLTKEDYIQDNMTSLGSNSDLSEY